MMEPVVDPERVARVAARLADSDGGHKRLCVACAAVVGVAGAGIVLMSRGQALGTVCVSDPVTEAVEDAQYTLGEGPCVEAYRTRSPVLAPDLSEGDRWPSFRNGAQAAGVHAAFGFPLLIGQVCLGALNLYHVHVGALTAEQVADAVTVAHIAGRTVLGWQSVAGPQSLAWQLEQVPAHRAAVHQATGMVSVQTAIPIDDALVLLRAYAFAEDRGINLVAEDVVARRLRFDGPPGPPES